ncbi:hypothetical protein PG990_005960 [Apiospora arundinis]
MCIIEYIGYSCGHSSVPVLRLCPMTTHAPTNPVCKDPSHRPTMVGDMCPACSRITHSRWVDIVMFEHQWMHERGTCGCPATFPALLHPRTIGAGTEQEAQQYTGSNTTLRGISNQMGNAMRSKFEQDSGASTSSNEDSSGTLTIASTNNFSPAINTGTVSMQASGSHRLSAKPTAATAPVEQPFTASSHAGQSQSQDKGKKKPQKSMKQRRKGKGQAKAKNWKYQKKDNSNCDLFPMSTPDTMPTLSSKDIIHTFHLPPAPSPLTAVGFHNASAGSSQKQVNVRLASQFATEWIPDHAELHRMGHCNCHVRFENYQPYKVTEVEYYAKREDSLGSKISSLKEMSARMEALGLSEIGVSGDVGNYSSYHGGDSAYPGVGEPAYSGIDDSSIITSAGFPTARDAKEKGDIVQQVDLFDPFAPSSSPSPVTMMMSDRGETGHTSMSAVYPEYVTLGTARVPYDDIHTFSADSPQFSHGPDSFTSMPFDQFSQTHYPAATPTGTAQAPVESLSSTGITVDTRPVLYSYLPEQTLRLSDIAQWRAIEAASDDDPEQTRRRWATASTRPEDFGFRTVEEAARALAATYPDEHANPIWSRPAAQVEAAEHLPNTLYYQHFDANDPSTYPLVAWPLGAGPEGGPEYSHSPRWDICHLSRPRLNRSRSLDGSS